MKKGRKSLNFKSALKLWSQHLINLLPLILGGIAIGTIFNLVVHQVPRIPFGDIREQIVSGKRWNIAKDPESRRGASESSNSLDSLADYNSLESSVPVEAIVLKETWKDPGLLNLSDFRYIISNKSLCKQDAKAPKDTKIVPVLIHTFRDQFSQREAIRKSWGSIPIYKKLDVRLVFLLGISNAKRDLLEEEEGNESSGDYTQSDSEEEQQKLEDEHDKYGDLLIGNFIDSSKNLTYKHMMGYKFVLTHCSDAVFVMKADISKFVDIIKWLDWRSKDLDILESKSTKSKGDDYVHEEADVPDLYCDVFSGGTPVREETSSFYASPEDWPEETYPDYCSSWAYGTTVSVMKKIFAVSSERKFFWIDDVYFGALLDLAKRKFNWEPKIEDCFKTNMGRPEKYREICEENGHEHFEKKKDFGPVVHVNDGDKFARDMMCLWNKTLHDSDYKFE